MVAQLVRPRSVPAALPATAWGRGLAWYQSNTGCRVASGSLTPSGDLTVDVDDAVITDLAIIGRVTIQAQRVTLRDCTIDSGTVANGLGLVVNTIENAANSVTVEHCSFTGSMQACVGYDNYTLYRCQLSGFHGDGGKVGDNVTWTECFMHSPARLGETHSDGLQVQTSPINVLVERCWIAMDDLGTNAATIIKADLGARTVSDNLVWRGNFLAGGHASTMQIVDVPPRYIEGLTVADNTLAPGFESDLPWTRYWAQTTAEQWVNSNNRTREGLLIADDGLPPEGSEVP